MSFQLIDTFLGLRKKIVIKTISRKKPKRKKRTIRSNISKTILHKNQSTIIFSTTEEKENF